MLEDVAYVIGIAVMVCGGAGLTCAIAWWASHCALRLWTNAGAIYRVAVHAREHGLDLRTGKAFNEKSAKGEQQEGQGE